MGIIPAATEFKEIQKTPEKLLGRNQQALFYSRIGKGLGKA